MQLDFQARELTVKLVYYGPALSGKTTNLQAIHKLTTDSSRGRLMTLETRDDRTLFFDLLPLNFRASSGVRVRVKLFTVPGQVIHGATRRLVLQGADGVAFIADSQKKETAANRAAFIDMQQNLRDNNIVPDRIPLVIQFNKRDLPDVRSDEEIDAMTERGKEPVYKAVAIRGIGVLDTLRGLLERTWDDLENRHNLRKKFALEPDDVVTGLASSLRDEAPVAGASS